MGVEDISTRFDLVDFVSTHASLAHDTARLALSGPGTRGLAPIAFVLGDDAVTFMPGDSTAIVTGVHDAATCVVQFCDERSFSDFFHELRTAPGAHMTGGVTYDRGGFGMFDEWEPSIRAVYQGRVVFDPANVDRTRITQVFTFDDDSDIDIGRFVTEFGFAVVRNVFSTDEIADMNTSISRLEIAATSDTPNTWWTTTPEGSEVPCQIHYATMRAPEIAWVEHDPRVTRLVRACLPDLVAHSDRMNGHFAVLKRPGARTGLTDLTWHIDCGLGGHTLLCPGLHIGIQLTASNPELGAFSVLAGSQFSSVRRAAVDTDTWPVVTVDTQPGDVTIHVPHVMHAAPPPTTTGDGRRTLYLGFGQPLAHDIIGAGNSFDDLLATTNG